MNAKLRAFAIFASILFGAGAGSARADWTYGCLGRLDSGESIHFDRATLVILKGDATPGEDGFRTFTSKTPDAGTGGPLTFRHSASGDTVALQRLSASAPTRATTELSCRLPAGRFGVRTMKRSRLRTTYRLSAPGLLSGDEGGVALDCYDETISNCR